MALTEQELLLLNCFMYSDIAPKYRGKDATVADVLDRFRDKSGNISLSKIKKSNIKLSGSLTEEQLYEVMKDMSASESIKKLVIADTTVEKKGGIRAACFVDPDTGKATVAFRGTGGSFNQWYNNLEGYGDVSQQTQRDAAAFINSLPYNNIDVTGHSNGGNQAMYVTVVCEDKISRCVSFEGQGESQEFVDKYIDAIIRNKGKIKNICGEKDFVNPLMIDIAGETIYVKSDSNQLFGIFDHGSYGIYSANKDALEGNNGTFPSSSYVDQAFYCKAIHKITLFVADHSDTPFVGPLLEHTADFAGILVGLLISKDISIDNLINVAKKIVITFKDFVFEEVKDLINAVNTICDRITEWFNKTFYGGYRYAEANPKIVVDTYRLTAYAERLGKVNSRISKLDERLDSLYWKVGLLGLWNLIQADALTGYSFRLRRCQNYLNNTASDFIKTENDLASKV